MGIKNRLHNYLRTVFLLDSDIWVHKGKLEQLAKDAGYLGDCATRRLRELYEENKIDKRESGRSMEYRYCPQIDELAKVVEKICTK